MKYEKAHYKVSDLASAWGCTVDDVLDMAEHGDISVFVWADFWRTEDGAGNCGVKNGPVALAPYEIARLRHPTGKPPLEDRVDVYTNGNGDFHLESVKVTNTQTSIDSLFVPREERERFEQEQIRSPGREEQKAHTASESARLQRDFNELFYKMRAEGKKPKKKTVAFELSKRAEYSNLDPSTIERKTKLPR